MRAFGLLDLEDLGISRGLELLNDNGGSDPDLSTLGVVLDIPADRRNIFGGSAVAQDTKARARRVLCACGCRPCT